MKKAVKKVVKKARKEPVIVTSFKRAVKSLSSQLDEANQRYLAMSLELQESRHSLQRARIVHENKIALMYQAIGELKGYKDRTHELDGLPRSAEPATVQTVDGPPGAIAYAHGQILSMPDTQLDRVNRELLDRLLGRQISDGVPDTENGLQDW